MDRSRSRFGTNEQRRERLFWTPTHGKRTVFKKTKLFGARCFWRAKTAAFESDQASQAKHSGWCSSARETLLLQGRQGRKDACAAIDAALLDQFNMLLKQQEDSFVSEEHRKDGIVKGLLDDAKSLKSSSLIVNDRANIPFPEVTYSDPRPYGALATAIPVSWRSSSRSRSRGRSRSIGEFEIVPSRRPSRSRSRSRMRSPSIIRRPRSPSSRPPYDEAPLPSPRHFPSTSDDSKGKESGRAERPQSIRDLFGKRFNDAQDERFQGFLDEERQREDHFQAAHTRGG